MRVRKTRQDQRNVYRYPVSVEDGRGGYRTVYTTVRPGEMGVTEVWIQDLHRMDDNEVTNNIKNGHPKLTVRGKVILQPQGKEFFTSRGNDFFT